MDIYSTKPIEEIGKQRLKEILNSKMIKVSPHAFDHLSKGQRKVFKENDLIDIIKKENSRKTYLQSNGRYACYYRRKDGYRKLIVDIQKDKAIIITFIHVDEVPKIK